MVDAKTSIEEAFGMADDVLRQGIGGISDLITKPGIINLDFADVKTVMKDAGSALMAIGHGSGETRCIDAAQEAIESPLLEMNIQGATGVLYNITGGTDLTLIETSEAAEIIRAAVDEEAEIIYGTSIDPSLGDAVRITLIATGFEQSGRFLRVRHCAAARGSRARCASRSGHYRPRRAAADLHAASRHDPGHLTGDAIPGGRLGGGVVDHQVPARAIGGLGKRSSAGSTCRADLRLKSCAAHFAAPTTPGSSTAAS